MSVPSTAVSSQAKLKREAETYVVNTVTLSAYCITRERRLELGLGLGLGLWRINRPEALPTSPGDIKIEEHLSLNTYRPGWRR